MTKKHIKWPKPHILSQDQIAVTKYSSGWLQQQNLFSHSSESESPRSEGDITSLSSVLFHVADSCLLAMS